jgi:hypothetical protein
MMTRTLCPSGLMLTMAVGCWGQGGCSAAGVCWVLRRGAGEVVACGVGPRCRFCAVLGQLCCVVGHAVCRCRVFRRGVYRTWWAVESVLADGSCSGLWQPSAPLRQTGQRVFPACGGGVPLSLGSSQHRAWSLVGVKTGSGCPLSGLRAWAQVPRPAGFWIASGGGGPERSRSAASFRPVSSGTRMLHKLVLHAVGIGDARPRSRVLGCRTRYTVSSRARRILRRGGCRRRDGGSGSRSPQLALSCYSICCTCHICPCGGFGTVVCEAVDQRLRSAGRPDQGTGRVVGGPSIV